MNTPSPSQPVETTTSESMPQPTEAQTSTITDFSPISSLFSLSIAKIKPVIKHLIGLEVIRTVTIFAVAVTFGLVFSLSIASSGILNNFDLNNPEQIQAMIGDLLLQSDVISTMILVIFIAGMAITWLSLIFAAALILRIDKSDQQIPFTQFLRDGVKISSGLFLLSLLVGIITLGATMIFLIPGLIASVVFSFAAYEIILYRTSISSSLKNSYTIISTHFLKIFFRVFVLGTVIVLINVFFELLAGDGSSAASAFVQLIGSIVGILVGWFAIAYSITLYREARSLTNLQQLKNPTWLYIVSGLGWIVIAVLGSYLWSMRAEITEGINAYFSTASSGSYIQMMNGDYAPTDLDYSDDPTSFPVERMLQEDGELNQEEFDAWLQQFNDENQLSE